MTIDVGEGTVRAGEVRASQARDRYGQQARKEKRNSKTNKAKQTNQNKQSTVNKKETKQKQNKQNTHARMNDNTDDTLKRAIGTASGLLEKQTKNSKTNKSKETKQNK